MRGGVSRGLTAIKARRGGAVVVRPKALTAVLFEAALDGTRPHLPFSTTSFSKAQERPIPAE